MCRRYSFFWIEFPLPLGFDATLLAPVLTLTLLLEARLRTAAELFIGFAEEKESSSSIGGFSGSVSPLLPVVPFAAVVAVELLCPGPFIQLNPFILSCSDRWSSFAVILRGRKRACTEQIIKQNNTSHIKYSNVRVMTRRINENIEQMISFPCSLITASPILMVFFWTKKKYPNKVTTRINDSRKIGDRRIWQIKIIMHARQ